MAGEDSTPEPDDQDPETPDTPDDEAEDTADDAADAAEQDETPDYSPKDRREATNKIRELAEERKALREENARLRSRQTAGGEEPEDDSAAYLHEQNALLAAEIYGPEASEAAAQVWDLWDDAETTTDRMAVLETYYDLRSQGATPAQAAAQAQPSQTREQRTQPRVDSNRSDMSPDSADEKEAEAVKKGDIGAVFAARMQKALGR